jgi:Epoxide hydrolase N terminus
MQKIKDVLTGIMMTTVSSIGYTQTGPPATANSSEAVVPYHFKIPREALDDLKKRVMATRWPNMETVNDPSQGVQLATMQKLAQYWATDYDWRKVEAKLNALPQFTTKIDGVDIYFIHVRSKEKNDHHHAWLAGFSH